MRLGGRVAIVTGGARHIGAAYGRRLATEGAAVVIADILDGGSVAEEIRSTGGRAIALTADVSSERDANRMAAEAVKAFGRIDILVNNAAIFINIHRHPFYEITAEEWDRVSAVNIKGPFLCSKAVFPQMKEQKTGKIINFLFDRLLGHAEFLALRRVESGADRHDALAGARSRRVRDLCQRDCAGFGGARGAERTEGVDRAATQGALHQALANSRGFDGNPDFSRVIRQRFHDRSDHRGRRGKRVSLMVRSSCGSNRSEFDCRFRLRD